MGALFFTDRRGAEGGGDGIYFGSDGFYRGFEAEFGFRGFSQGADRTGSEHL